MIQSPSVSFIVPLYNHLEHTRVMLDSLLASLPAWLDFEVVLVDDNSSDGTPCWLQTLNGPNFRVVLNPSNLGFARANHAGVTLATGDVLALLNNDLIFSPGWLEPMLAVLQNPQLGAGVVGNVQTRVADGALDHAGVQVNALGQVTHVQALPQNTAAPWRVFAVTGACCLVRRDVFDAVGGFDEAFVNGCEDIDLCLKVKAKGLHVYMAYDSVVQHHVSLSRSRTSQQNELNSRFLYQKWRSVIKTELACVWQQALRGLAGAAVPADALQDLKLSFVATPFAAAQVMAESALLRQEARWARLLDQVDPNDGLAIGWRSTGLQRHADDPYYKLTNPVVQVVINRPQGLKSLNGFYISGQQIKPPLDQQTQVTITANGIQEKTFILGTQRHFNLGISHPVVLPLVENSFEIKFEALADKALTALVDPCQYISLAHFVVDEKMVGSHA